MRVATIAPPFYERSDVARIFGVSVSAVLKWELAGIISPLRTVGGSRLYTEDDVATIRRVREERAMPQRRRQATAS